MNEELENAIADNPEMKAAEIVYEMNKLGRGVEFLVAARATENASGTMVSAHGLPRDCFEMVAQIIVSLAETYVKPEYREANGLEGATLKVLQEVRAIALDHADNFSDAKRDMTKFLPKDSKEGGQK